MILRIIIHDYPGHPFQVQLSRELARRGHDVLHLYAGYNQTPRGILTQKVSDPKSFKVKPIFIKVPLQKYSFYKRWLQEREYGQLLSTTIKDYSPDVVISANTPLDAQSILQKTCKLDGVRFIFWLQDVIGLATLRILAKKIPILGQIIGLYYISLERNLLRQSDRIVLITEDFQPLLREWGIGIDKAVVIPNWTPIESIPVMPRTNEWSIKHNLDKYFCFMYAGTLGLKHNPEFLLQLAQHFSNNPKVRIVVISETTGAEWLREKVNERQLNNLLILDFQQFEELHLVLASSDVLVALLNDDAGVYSVPSKVLTYLCAQRPLLLAVPEGNFSTRIVKQSQAGIVVNSDDVVGFIRGAEELLKNDSMRDLFGKNGRSYAEKNFNIQLITDKFEKILISK